MKLCRVCDLDAIRNNLKTIKDRAGTDLLFMVKCNAYGHGMCEVAKATEDLVAYFGVATISEALRLRTEGIIKPVLASVFLPQETDNILLNDITCAVYNADHVRLLECAAKRTGRKAKVHVKLDTGMNRLGISDESEALAIIKMLEKRRDFIIVEGVYSHLRSVNLAQIERFEKLTALFIKSFPGLIRHIAATSAVEAGVGLNYEMVRVGIGGYGYGMDGLTPALSVMTEVLVSRRAKKGEFVGYGEHKLDKDTNIAVLLGGYGDGVLRGTKHVLIRGEKRNILAAPCMDMLIIDTGSELAKIGETAILLGPGLTAEDLAEENGTIPYEILTAFDRSRSEMYYFI